MAQEYVLSEQDEYLGHPQRHVCGIKVSICFTRVRPHCTGQS